MNSDYTGTVLPLLDDFCPAISAPVSAPWLRPEQSYAKIADAYERYGA
jgi:hypothetical protein